MRNLATDSVLATNYYAFNPQPAINSKVYPDSDLDDDGEMEMSKGDHGYDHEYVAEMNTIMYAYGPDIHAGQVIKQMEQVDHYNIFCQLLDLEPRANNGTTELYSKILFKFKDEEAVTADADENDGEEKGEIQVENKHDESDDDDNGSGQLHHPGTIWLQGTIAFGVAFALLL